MGEEINLSQKKTNQQPTLLKKVVQIVWDMLFLLLLVVILGTAIIFKFSDSPDKSFFGYRVYSVLTDSMRKTQKDQTGNFDRGDMVVVKITDSETIKEGDIVTFLPSPDNPETYLTHRVVKRIEPASTGGYAHFVTRGDANNLDDDEISGEQIIGKVVFVIPFAGRVIEFIRNNLVMSIVIAVIVIALFTLIKGYFQDK